MRSGAAVAKRQGEGSMKKIVALGVSIFIAMLAGCTSGLDRKLDGSSEKAFETSLADMKKSAKPDDVARLDDALLVLAITDVSIGYEGGSSTSMGRLPT